MAKVNSATAQVGIRSMSAESCRGEFAHAGVVGDDHRGVQGVVEPADDLEHRGRRGAVQARHRDDLAGS